MAYFTVVDGGSLRQAITNGAIAFVTGEAFEAVGAAGADVVLRRGSKMRRGSEMSKGSLFNKRERVLIERLGKAKYELRDDQLTAPFRFLISPTTTSGVAISKISMAFQDGVFRRIKNFDFQSPISGVVVFPKILDPQIASMPDHLTYKRKERSVFVGINIPFSRWVEASSDRRIELLAENISESLRRVPSDRLCDSDRNELLQAVEDVQRKIKYTPLH